MGQCGTERVDHWVASLKIPSGQIEISVPPLGTHWSWGWTVTVISDGEQMPAELRSDLSELAHANGLTIMEDDIKKLGLEEEEFCDKNALHITAHDGKLLMPLISAILDRYL